MSVYKEGFKALELIQSRSRQIYPDAADFGVLVKKGDEVWNAAKQLADMYGDKSTRQFDKYSTGKSVKIKIELLDEWAYSDGIKTAKEAEENYMLDYCTVSDKKGYIGLISVYKI